VVEMSFAVCLQNHCLGLSLPFTLNQLLGICKILHNELHIITGLTRQRWLWQ